MRILLSCIHYPVAAGRFMFWALRGLGHEVLTVGPAVGPYLPWAGERNLEPYEWKPDVAVSYDGSGAMRTTTDWAIQKLEVKPDLIIQMDANFIMQGKPPCPNVLYAIDNHVGAYGAYETFDRIFIAHSWGAMHYLPQSEWLPCAYDEKQHYDKGLARPGEVVIVGANYGPRFELVEFLRGRGVDVLATTGPIYEEYNALYNMAKIALVKSVKGDLAMRVFENMAQGCLVVADRAPDIAKAGFVDGVHYLGYDSPAECHAAISWARHNWGAAQAIIANAKQAVKPHTWEARARRILEAVA